MENSHRSVFFRALAAYPNRTGGEGQGLHGGYFEEGRTRNYNRSHAPGDYLFTNEYKRLHRLCMPNMYVFRCFPRLPRFFSVLKAGGFPVVRAELPDFSTFMAKITLE